MAEPDTVYFGRDEQQKCDFDQGKRTVNKRGQVRPTTYRKRRKGVSELVKDIITEPSEDSNMIEICRDGETSNEMTTQPTTTTQESQEQLHTYPQGDDALEPSADLQFTCVSDHTEILSSSNDSSSNNIQPIKDAGQIEHLLSQIICDHTINMDDYVIQEDDVKEKKTQWTSEEADPHIDSEESEPTDSSPLDGEENEFIYEGHNMPRTVSVLLILLYTIKYAVTGDQLSDLLTLISAHCITVHPWLKSVFLFKKFFANIKSPLVKHFYCKSCLASVLATDDMCPNMQCRKNLQEFKTKLYFLEIPIESQLKSLFSQANFVKLILKRFSRDKSHVNNLEDIYDGEIYKNLCRTAGPLSEVNPYNISFTWNTDGIPVFKSSNFSIWPMYLTINELPFKYRFTKEFSVFSGLWFGDMKPFMPTFSKHLHSSLKELETQGLTVNIGEKQTKIHAYLICGTADLPAKSVMMNMNQFNGAFGCQRCLSKGETERTEKGGNIHVYQYGKGEQRTATGSVADAIQATQAGEIVHGIKGPSILMTLGAYDFVKGTGIDYMHGALLGITKLLLKLWFSSCHRNDTYSLYQYIDVVDDRLKMIKPPNQITRVPRAISSHLAYWKASELRSWLFFYSLPVLSDIMAPVYFLHFASFCESIFILNKDSISMKEIENCEIMLNYFVFMFPKLYKVRFSTLNLHLLLHLPDCVKQLGPLWVYSCFPFENMNGFLTKFFHGTQYIELQIASSINMVQTLPSLVASVPYEFKAITSKLLSHKLIVDENPKRTHLGKGYKRELNNIVMQKAIKALQHCLPNNLTFYNRCLVRSCVIHSTDYKRVQVRNTYTIKFLSCESNEIMYGHVRYFAKDCSCSQRSGTKCNCNGKILAFISALERSSTTLIKSVDNYVNVTLRHINVLKKNTDLCVTDVITIDRIVSVCVYIDFPEQEDVFICEFPNFHELD